VTNEHCQSHQNQLRQMLALRTRYFMSAPLLTANSDLLLTCPRQLAIYFARQVNLRIIEPPMTLPPYFEQIAWHARFDADPASLWLRSTLRRAVDEVIGRE